MSTQPADDGGGGDVTITDRELYDHAISDPAPAPSTPEPAAPPTTAPEQLQPVPQQPGDRLRDGQGRFAPRQGQQQPPDQGQGQVPDQPQQPQAPQRQPEDHRVPLATMMQERERAYRAEAELQQVKQAWAQYQQAQQAATQQQQAPQTIYDDPDSYLTNRVMNPLRQEAYAEMMKIKDGMSRAMANQQWGERSEQLINEALQDLQSIRNTPHGEGLFREIMENGHPYGALVQWHHQAKAQKAMGSDPNAWLRKQQQVWFQDPKVRAAMLEDMRKQQQGSNRPPNVELPPSLSSMPAASGRLEDEGDLSSESLYRFAIK